MNKINRLGALPVLILAAVIINLTGCIGSPELKADTQSKSKSQSTAKPNIVWLITEDNSKHYLKLYDDSGA